MRTARTVVATSLAILGGSAALAFGFAPAPVPAAAPPASFDAQLGPARLALTHADVPVVQPAVGAYVGETAVETAPGAVCLEVLEDGIVTQCGTTADRLDSLPGLVGPAPAAEAAGPSVTGWQDDPQPEPMPVRATPHEDPAPAGIDHRVEAPLDGCAR